MVAPPRKLAGRVEGLGYWRPFDIGGDFAYFREHPTRRAVYPTMRRDFHRWAYYALWDDYSALRAFLDSDNGACPWHRNAAEAWHLWMRPVAARGA